MKTIFNNKKKKNDTVIFSLYFSHYIFIFSHYIFSFDLLGDNASIFFPRSVVLVIMRDKSALYRQKSLFVNSVRCDSVKDKHGII